MSSLTPPMRPSRDLDAPPFNLRASSFFIVTDHHRCWKCGDNAQVSAIGIKSPFTHRDLNNHWREITDIAILSYVEHLPTSVSRHLTLLLPRFFRDDSHWHQRPYWMNHCQHCDAKIGDYETIDAPGAPFNVQRFDAEKRTLTIIEENFEAAAIANKLVTSRHSHHATPTGSGEARDHKSRDNDPTLPSHFDGSGDEKLV